ncbi:MAG: hypothetical protein ABI411_16210 [Tahibacter sp.]
MAALPLAAAGFSSAGGGIEAAGLTATVAAGVVTAAGLVFVGVATAVFVALTGGAEGMAATGAGGGVDAAGAITVAGAVTSPGDARGSSRAAGVVDEAGGGALAATRVGCVSTLCGTGAHATKVQTSNDRPIRNPARGILIDFPRLTAVAVAAITHHAIPARGNVWFAKANVVELRSAWRHRMRDFAAEPDKGGENLCRVVTPASDA